MWHLDDFFHHRTQDPSELRLVYVNRHDWATSARHGTRYPPAQEWRLETLGSRPELPQFNLFNRSPLIRSQGVLLSARHVLDTHKGWLQLVRLCVSLTD